MNDITYKKERFETVLSVDDMMKKYYDYKTTYEKCSRCTGFGLTWSCPDLSFDPRDFWRRYTSFRFIVDRVSNEGAPGPKEAQERLFAEKKIFDAQMLDLESDFPGSISLVAQECNLCKKCARLQNRPCVHPDSMRYALESLGMLAVNMVRDCFGFDALWSDGTSVPDYYLLVGGLLTK